MTMAAALVAGPVVAPADPMIYDILDERQRTALTYWQGLVGLGQATHLAHFHPARLPATVAPVSMLVEMAERPVAQAVLLWCGQEIGCFFPSDALGRTLQQLVPASYAADLSPAYALCRSLGVPVAAEEEITYADGSRNGLRRLMLPVGLHPEEHEQRASHLLLVYGDYVLPDGTLGVGQPVANLVSLTSHRLHVFADGPGPASEA